MNPKRGLLTTLWGVTLASLARSAEYTVSNSWSYTGIGANYEIFGSHTTLSSDAVLPVPVFDSSLGTLEAVRFDYRANEWVSGHASQTFPDGTPIVSPSGRFDYDFQVLVGPAVYSTAQYDAVFSASGHHVDATPSNAYSFGDGYSFSKTVVHTDPADLSLIAAGTLGTLYIDFFTFASQLSISPHQPFSDFDHNFTSIDSNLSVDVTYRYQPVPEPTTVAGIALGFVGVLRRRRE